MRSLVNLLLFLSAVEVVVRFWWRTGRRLRRFPDRVEQVVALRGVLVFLVVVMLMNAFGLVSSVVVQQIELMNDGVTSSLRLLRGPASLVLGTWGIFSLIAAALTRGVFTEEHGDLAVLRGMVSAMEALLVRFALPLIGLGTVFGVMGEGLVAAVLFFELLFVWALLRGYLFLRVRAEPVR